jgi:twitching motility protein PilT
MEAFHVEQKVKSLLLLVAQQGASDIHFVVGRYPTLRIDGKLQPISKEKMLTAEDTKAISKVFLNEEKEKELTGTGETGFSYNFENKARFRVNIFFQKGTISIVMRLVQTKIRTLDELNMPTALYDFTKHSQGLVLVTGPVGHGKSTTMAALVDYINHNYEKSIITIEDPIEYIYEQDRCIINQREIGQDAQSFERALRAIFREDANVVLIGEMRDLETISTTLTAAETGHLIFATIHTNNSAETVDRIVDVFPAHQQNQVRSQLANVLLGVVSQRLVPKIGGDRIPAIEIMVKNTAVENLIREDRAYQIDSVIETGMKEGMVSLDKSLSEMVKKGLITVDDAFAYAKNKDYLKMLIKK